MILILIFQSSWSIDSLRTESLGNSTRILRKAEFFDTYVISFTLRSFFHMTQWLVNGTLYGKGVATVGKGVDVIRMKY